VPGTSVNEQGQSTSRVRAAQASARPFELYFKLDSKEVPGEIGSLRANVVTRLASKPFRFGSSKTEFHVKQGSGIGPPNNDVR